MSLQGKLDVICDVFPTQEKGFRVFSGCRSGHKIWELLGAKENLVVCLVAPGRDLWMFCGLQKGFMGYL